MSSFLTPSMLGGVANHNINSSYWVIFLSSSGLSGGMASFFISYSGGVMSRLGGVSSSSGGVFSGGIVCISCDLLGPVEYAPYPVEVSSESVASLWSSGGLASYLGIGLWYMHMRFLAMLRMFPHHFIVS